MMKTVIIACKTIEDEVLYAVGTVGAVCPIKWIESGLHDSPKRLKVRLQEELNATDANRVLLAFGYCGNAILGLETGNFELIIPRVEDCISLLIGSNTERMKISAEHAAYFLTEGWLRGERNLWVEYQHSLEKYGKEITDMISEKLYGHYRTLGLLNCGISQFSSLIESTKTIADTLNLKQQEIPASVLYIEQLIKGPWPKEKFITKPPHSLIAADDMYL